MESDDYKTDERTRARCKRYYERHRDKINAGSREKRRATPSALDLALKEGPAAVEALRAKWRAKNRRWYERQALKEGRVYSPGSKGGQGERSTKLVVAIPPRPISPDNRDKHADLNWLITQAGPVAVRRARSRSSAARRDFAVWTAAASSLPARPVAAEWSDWLAALGRGAHGGPPLKPTSLADIFYRCAALYRAGRLLGMEVRNPFAELDEPRSTDFPASFSWRIMIDGFPRLIAATTEWRERAFYSALRFTGLRINEILGLRREHILILPGGRVEIQVTTQRPHKSARASLTNIIDRPLKHERQRRILPITNADLVSALLRARRETPSQVLTKGPDNRPLLVSSPFLFPFSPYHVGEMTKHLRAVIPELPRGVGWHAFRHAFSAEARLVARVSIDELSQWLGHASPLVTYTYLRSLLGEQPDLQDFSARIGAAQLRRPVEAVAAPSNVTDMRKR